MLDLLKRRRSIRKFKPTPINPEKIERLVKAALLAPSSRNRCPWEFIVVDARVLLDKLSMAREHGSAFLKGAPLCIVVLGDEKLSDVWIEDTSIAAVFIQLMAEAIGLGSCWIQVRNRMHNADTTAEEYMRKTLNIPSNKRVESIIALGYPDECKAPHREEELGMEKIHRNGYGYHFFDGVS